MSESLPPIQGRPAWRNGLGNLIFGLETPLARAYNIFMILMVVLSVWLRHVRKCKYV